jgi:CYTH domain-containing protein
MYEIERKFLLSRPAAEIILEARTAGHLVESHQIEQRYLEDTGEWTLRCRRTSTLNSVQCFLTLKRRISSERCVELESPVDVQFYEDMASQCGPALTKTRSKITVDSHVWEIDVFDTPELWGTEIAEIELSSEGEEFAIPSWLGAEITGDRAYTNEAMAAKVRQIRDAA